MVGTTAIRRPLRRCSCAERRIVVMSSTMRGMSENPLPEGRLNELHGEFRRGVPFVEDRIHFHDLKGRHEPGLGDDSMMRWASR